MSTSPPDNPGDLDVILRIPPVTLRIRSPFSSVRRHLARHYPTYQGVKPDGFVDFDIEIKNAAGLRRFVSPQARFIVDGEEPFLPLPGDQAAPLFEWGLNWCLASRPLGLLTIHAAVLARNDQAILLPGFPGAGKSTLCAALTFLGGWRLLSDELALIEPDSSTLLPNPRPISLKNQSIEIVRGFSGAVLGEAYLDTRKGTVCHAAAPLASVAQGETPARCRWVVFPKFLAEGGSSVTEISRSEAFSLIAQQSFNKERMGERGFAGLCNLLAGARCFQIGYRSTSESLELIDAVTRLP